MKPRLWNFGVSRLPSVLEALETREGSSTSLGLAVGPPGDGPKDQTYGGLVTRGLAPTFRTGSEEWKSSAQGVVPRADADGLQVFLCLMTSRLDLDTNSSLTLGAFGSSAIASLGPVARPHLRGAARQQRAQATMAGALGGCRGVPTPRRFACRVQVRRAGLRGSAVSGQVRSTAATEVQRRVQQWRLQV